jgi:hypothetical protein
MNGQANNECRSLAYAAFDPNPSLMSVNRLLAARKPDARATFSGRIWARLSGKERLKDLRQNVCWNTATAVAER